MSDKALRGNKLTAGRPGFGLGSAVKAATKLGVKIVKGKKNPLRMDQPLFFSSVSKYLCSLYTKYARTYKYP